MQFKIEIGLDTIKSQLSAQVDAEAGFVRQLFISVGAGQEMVYQAKFEEAQLIVADPGQGTNVPEAETPHLTKEAATNGVTRYDMAVVVLTIRQQWATVSPLIEDRRLTTKTAIDNATTVAAARQAALINWDDIKAFASPG
jgi:hypothetical protein